MDFTVEELRFAGDIIIEILDWFEDEPDAVEEFREWRRLSGRAE